MIVSVVDQGDTYFLPVKIWADLIKKLLSAVCLKTTCRLLLDMALLNLEIKSRFLKRIDPRVSRRVELST